MREWRPEPWSVVVGVSIPVTIDLYLEPERFGIFMFCAVFFGVVAALVWSLATDPPKK